jgi:sugar O-acyltransferase (sialic acid O-acetyltransferase NeuD family)
MSQKIVIFGTSNILSDLFDCALANGLGVAKVVIHLPEETGKHGITLAERLAALAAFGENPVVENLEDFSPGPDECYLLGPTTPTRIALVRELESRFDLHFSTLIHPTAYVSPFASIGKGVFIGANSVIGPGAVLADHVFVNRGVTVGHDTHIGAFSRLQPGCNLGGLSRIGHSVTVAIGATLTERLVVGNNAFIGAGSIVAADVPDDASVIAGRTRLKKADAGDQA